LSELLLGQLATLSPLLLSPPLPPNTPLPSLPPEPPFIGTGERERWEEEKSGKKQKRKRKKIGGKKILKKIE
jgi:hypothetical protein